MVHSTFAQATTSTFSYLLLVLCGGTTRARDRQRSRSEQRKLCVHNRLFHFSFLYFSISLFFNERQKKIAKIAHTHTHIHARTQYKNPCFAVFARCARNSLCFHEFPFQRCGDYFSFYCTIVYLCPILGRMCAGPSEVSSLRTTSFFVSISPGTKTANSDDSFVRYTQLRRNPSKVRSAACHTHTHARANTLRSGFFF